MAGYIPTEHDNKRLVAEGEQIERAEVLSDSNVAVSNNKSDLQEINKTNKIKTNGMIQTNGPHWNSQRKEFLGL